MNLQENITQDLKEAMKSKQAATLSTLRMLKSALKNKQIELMHDLTEQEVIAVIKSQIKQLQDSLALFEQAGRQETADSVRAEILVLEHYLPAQLEEVELEHIVKEALTSSGIESKEEMGKAMGAVMKAVAGKADGSRVREMVERLLATLVFVVGGVTLFTTRAQAALDPMSKEFLISILRIGRMFFLVLGIVFVVFLLIGGFNYMLSSGRNDDQMAATRKVVIGIIGTISVAIFFTVFSVLLAGM